MAEATVGFVGSKANRTSVNIVGRGTTQTGKGATLPAGYTPKENSVTGLKDGVYNNTRKVDA
ncbi:hypothetical protein C6H65_23930 [Photorhabdus luminescens]|nr:hypothetical protein C6H65_23930 [Photorhabdus luminescens]